MPTDIQTIIKDPDFLKMPPEEQKKVLRFVDKDYASMPDGDQDNVLMMITGRETATEQPVPQWGIENPNLYGAYGAAKEVYKQAIKPAIKTAGFALGSPMGPAGAGLVYGMAGNVADNIERGIDSLETGKFKAPSIQDALTRSATDVAEGATGEMAGRSIVPVAKAVGKVGAEVLGRLSGGGSMTAKEALKAGAKGGAKSAFGQAMRGELTGREVVDMAHRALVNIKDYMGAEYRAKLAKIAKTNPEIDFTPIYNKYQELLKTYNIKVVTDPKTGKATYDMSRIDMAEDGARVIRKVLKRMDSWGTQADDFTALGIDRLKKYIGDLYAPTSQSRAFVASLEDTISGTLKKAVPGYADMTRGYAKTIELIKDVESNLMMRKQGMSGRIVADQTLRRLISAMKDNFELRGELVKALTEQGGEDVVGAVSGYAMSSWMPRGITGSGTSIMATTALAKFLNPAIYPMVAMASPRVQGELLMALGKYAPTVSRVATPAGQTAARIGTVEGAERLPR